MKKIPLLLLLFCNLTLAQSFSISKSASSELLITRDKSGVDSCGTRTVIIYVDKQKKHKLRAIDFSLTVYANFAAVIKFGALDADEKTIKVSNIARQSQIYLSLPSRNINLVSEKSIPSETANYTLASAGDITSVTAMLFAIVKGQSIQIQLPRKGESVAMTTQFATSFPSEERLAFENCMDNLLERMKLDTNSKTEIKR